MARILAVDPASDGAAVLIEGLPSSLGAEIRVLGALTWKAVAAGYLVTWARPLLFGLGAVELFRYTMSSLPHVGYAIPKILGCQGSAYASPAHGDNDAPDALVVEDTYASPVNPKAGLRVARMAGRLDGGIQLALKVPIAIREVLPGAWRGALGLPKSRDRETAKAASLAQIPVLLPGLQPFHDALGKVDHLTDAAGIALTGLRYSAWEDEAWAVLAAEAKARRKPRRKKPT